MEQTREGTLSREGLPASIANALEDVRREWRATHHYADSQGYETAHPASRSRIDRDVDGALEALADALQKELQDVRRLDWLLKQAELVEGIRPALVFGYELRNRTQATDKRAIIDHAMRSPLLPQGNHE